jgi:hypothetical protein
MPVAHTLLLTATIAPRPPFDRIKRSDPQLRLADYTRTLKRYLELNSPLINAIVFCDNSGFDLSPLRRLVGPSCRMPVEFLSYEEPAPPPGMHYGFCELHLIRYALSNSALLADSQNFIKVTGRLFFHDLHRLIMLAPTGYKALVDHRGIHRHEVGLPIRARTQLMLFEKAFYCRQIDAIADAMPGRRDSHIEEFISYCLLRSNCEFDATDIYYRFPVSCDPSGTSGDGFHYNGLYSRLKSATISVLRRLFPSLYA